MTFTAEKRERLLGLLAAGEPLGRACELVGVSRWTVRRWAEAGRSAGATVEQRVFAERLAAIRRGATNGHGELVDGEAEALLVRAARRGSVSAVVELRRRVRPEPEPPDDLPADNPWAWVQAGDPFTALEPDRMAMLTPEQQTEAVRVTEAAHAR